MDVLSDPAYCTQDGNVVHAAADRERGAHSSHLYGVFLPLPLFLTKQKSCFVRRLSDSVIRCDDCGNLSRIHCLQLSRCDGQKLATLQVRDIKCR